MRKKNPGYPAKQLKTLRGFSRRPFGQIFFVRQRRTGKIWDKKGFTISELILVFAVVFIIGVLMLPFIRYNHRDMVKIACTRNMQEIGLALYIYAREHDGQFPPEFKVLYDEQYLSDEKVLDCPASKSAGDIKSPDYLYTGGLSIRDSSTAILVQDKIKNHVYGGNVLYVDGTIEWKNELVSGDTAETDERVSFGVVAE